MSFSGHCKNYVASNLIERKNKWRRWLPGAVNAEPIKRCARDESRTYAVLKAISQDYSGCVVTLVTFIGILLLQCSILNVARDEPRVP